MTADEKIEALLGRSLDDDQESRRFLLQRASDSEPGRCWEATSEFEYYEAMLPPATEEGDGEESHFFCGDVELIVRRRIRSAAPVTPPSTLRDLLTQLPAEERRAVVRSFVSEAQVSCAYEGVELDAESLARRLDAVVGKLDVRH